jgi:diadenosine tetraphosphate (Ap4A) HIT family hydrolase
MSLLLERYSAAMTPAERLQTLAEGRQPAMIARMSSGFAVMGDTQFLPGYSLLLAYPMVEQLTDLPRAGRLAFLGDMATLGEAVKRATGCRRVNFSIYGNLDPFLHAHVWPRYAHEDPAYRTLPPFLYPPALRDDPLVAFRVSAHGPLQERIAAELKRLARA